MVLSLHSLSGLINSCFGFLGFYIQGGEKTGALVFVAGLVGACLGALQQPGVCRVLLAPRGLVGFGFILLLILLA